MLDIFCVLMSQFLNRVISAATVTPKRILNVNVMDEKNWWPAKDVDCGIAASKLLKRRCRKKLTTVWQKESFQLDCIKFLASINVKIAEKSLPNYKVTWAVMCGSKFTSEKSAAFWKKDSSVWLKYCMKEGVHSVCCWR